jgi:FkbM family methyltransferase
MRLPIVAGVLRGRWWLAESRGKIARVLLGTYEPEQTALFERWLRPGDTVLDVGAHVGYYTLVAATLVGGLGRVWAFEPNPANARFLREHVRINKLEHVAIEQLAVSDREGTARFARGSGSGTGHLDEGGALEVPTVSLDGFCARHRVAPAAIKIDVEGAELAVLEGAGDVIRRHRPVIFLSTHGPRVHAQCLALLRAAGYTLSAILGSDVEHTSELLCVPGEPSARERMS